MSELHILILSLIQGITEFLPISSSAHLILLPLLAGWRDQGLAIDVAAHMGSLLALLLYFRKDLSTYARNHSLWQWRSLHGFAAIGSIPVLAVGFLGHDFIAHHLREPVVIAAATILFGLVLWFADARRSHERSLHSLSLKDALWIGCAQTLALIPGASRSGVTMTAALMLGLTRQAAVRFSFALGGIAILAATAYESMKLWQIGMNAEWSEFAATILLSCASAIVTLHLFLRFLDRIGMLPFIIYRLVLGCALLWLCT